MHSYKLLRVCMTCIFVASKVEETPVRLRCILACFDRLIKRRAGFEPTPLSEQRYDIWAAGVFSCESVLLRELGFELYIDLPHAFILHFLNYLHPNIEDTSEDEQYKWSQLRQRSWNALNDALLSSRLLFTFHPHVLACGAIVVAASLLSLTLPPEWWILFDVQTDKLDACALEFAQLYALLSRQSNNVGGIDYTSAHIDDNENTNELCKFRPVNRIQKLEAIKKEREEKIAAAAATSSNSEESKTDTAPPAVTAPSAPMETS
jgi:hypothetical protein